LSSSFLVSIILFSALIVNVSASEEVALGAAERSLYINCGISGTNTLRVSRPELRVLMHSSGKTIVTSLDSSSRLHVKVISSAGVILADTLITTPSSVGMSGSIAELDASNVIITCAEVNDFKVYFIIYNIITFTQTPHSTTWSGSGAEAIFNIGQLYYYNGVWYTPVLAVSYNGGYNTHMCKYTVSTSTASNTDLSVTAQFEMGFQDPDNLKMLYLIACKSTPDYYKYDCSTGSLSILATNPFSDEYPDYPAYANMQTYLGGGIYQEGTYYYVYHVWLFSFLSGGTTGIRQVKTIHWTGKFNNSITSGTLTSQVRKEVISVDSSSSTSVSPGISWGWLHLIANSSTYDVYAYYQDIYGGKYISRDTLHIVDITTMSATFDTQTTLKGVDGIDFTYKSFDANIACLPESEISYQEVDNSNSYLYLGEIPMSVNYSETFTYSPADSPLLTGKYYTLTWTIYKNGIVNYFNDTYQFMFDGLLMKTGTLNNGKAIISIMVNTSGQHTFQILILDGLTEELLFVGAVRTYAFSSSVAPSNEIPTPPTLIGYYSDIFMVWLPIGIVVFLPLVSCTMLGAKYAGSAGAITGMIFGGATGMIGGTVTGIIPTYALYLFVLLTAIAIVVLFTRGSSGGGGGEV
jgi:hypothetical protein